MMISTCLGVLVVLGGAQPAEATGSATRLGNRITVYGSGLHVDSVTTARTPHRIQAQAFLTLREKNGKWMRNLRGWTSADTTGDTDHTTWSINENFPNGSRLCTEWKDLSGQILPGMACMIIHR
ncbi:hypothetical protein K2224_01370 [Streptomyces sp. BHT-5-2]|uniref:hypothetical protein n=1 Tax=Streptomyces sp. BHT-5-2 TaxID=2866715 RepID=UPI001C8D9BC4|nr:hypothetical protein [Streptomyces sp. BHT-5-2]QZL02034.1 hypothetical protein K2224_01370 [Streptomyces sp. BHT-5-2]